MPKATEVWATLDLVDRANDLPNGIDGIGDHGAASRIGNCGVRPMYEARPCAGAG
jgi:hypothetical protein